MIIITKEEMKICILKRSNNVKVFVRIKPSSISLTQKSIKLINDQSITIYNEKKGNQYRYYFDYIYGSLSNTSDIFHQVVEPLIYSAINGYNAIFFIYGYPGTGK